MQFSLLFCNIKRFLSLFFRKKNSILHLKIFAANLQILGQPNYFSQIAS